MRILFLIVALIELTSLLNAQSISGSVVDENNQAIQDAYIINKNSDAHAHSSENGEFLLDNVALNDTLICSHLGYYSRLMVINDLNQPIQFVLKPTSINLHEIIISPKLNALNLIADIDIKTKPVNSSQDVLRQIPGLFIGQHAGGGKAEQIFVRGFDIDHGTDINITVDGLPVNMVSHAHGQGYADLHFVIPETIEKIDFGKGPYFASQGNFNTAAYVNFMSKQRLNSSTFKLEAGEYDSYRIMSMLNLLNNARQQAYVAFEHIATDGPFLSPQNFNRTNLFGKYTNYVSPTDKLELSLSHFNSQWDASGQIPQRAVDKGIISRFGAIDDTEGGNTSRNNLTLKHHKMIGDNSSIQTMIYMSQYDFELYSNFTFFLMDTANGDQIRQKEDRTLYGFKSSYKRSYAKSGIEGYWQAGISLRNDLSNGNELSHTKNRSETLLPISLGSINETNYGSFLEHSISFKKLTINAALRWDYFDFEYKDALIPMYKVESENQGILSPKLNFIYHPSSRLQLYAKSGKGFHSNDSRVVINKQGAKTLPSAYGSDLGFIWKPTKNMLVNLAYWYLFLQQEFVYVGDAGIVEPSGKTRRKGVDLNFRYQPFEWLFWNLDATYTIARSIDDPSGEDYIPLAPAFTFSSGLNFKNKSGLYAGISSRHLADRPANEDYSITARAYSLVDLNAGYQWKQVGLGFQVQNLFNKDWEEAQFATESRLKNESIAVEEIHFTPGIPFFIKAIVEYRF